MIFFFDTSALIKRYVDEKGSKRVDEFFENASRIFVSSITKVESFSALRRLHSEKLITQKEYLLLKKEITLDFSFFDVTPLTKEIESLAISLVEKHQLKTLDSIQLASFIFQKETIEQFIVSDTKLCIAAKNEQLNYINPLD